MTLAASMQADITGFFEGLLGRNSVVTDDRTLSQYGIDGIAPRVVLRPETPEQISAALRIANEQNLTVVPFGGGTQQHVGNLPEQVDVSLSTERLSRIEAYDPGDLTISVQAGVSVSDVVELCAAERQLLPIEAGARATIGGALASSTCGPLRAGFGGLRDFCIGISFITGDGVSARGGGRVVKNVAGYDLMKLMVGSYGTLGVITSANFKVFPLPQQTITLVAEFGSPAEVAKFREWLLRSPLSPICVEVISPEASEYFKDSEPRDPDHWSPESPITAADSPWQVALRFAGTERVLARCRQELGAYAGRELVAAAESEFWKQISEFEERVIRAHRNAMIFKVSVPIAEADATFVAAQSAATEYNFVAAMVGRLSVGSFVIAFLPLAIDPPAVTQFAGAASDFRSRISKSSSAVAVRCPREAKAHFDVWGSTPTDTVLMQKIRRALDPKGILNRGRFLAG